MSIYGPYRRIVSVGKHEASGTVITMDCGHTWTLVSHMHMTDRSIGESKPCGDCKAAIPESEARVMDGNR